MGDRWTRTVLGALAAWIIASAGLDLGGFEQPTGLVTLLRFLASDAFIVAAVLRVHRWRGTGDVAQLRHAAGLAAAGLVFPLTSTLSLWTRDGTHLNAVGIAIHAAVLVAIAPLITDRHGFGTGHLAVGLLGAALGLRTASSHLAGSLEPFAQGLLAAAAALLLGAAVAEARAAVSEAERADELELALAVAEARLERTRRAQEERLHDARSAVAGVLGVSAMLADDRAATPDRLTLQRAVEEELARLATVLDVEAAEPVTDFDVRDALTPTLLLHALEGVRLTWDLPRSQVTGRPRATATALDNLLRNARTHAPGAAIFVWSRRRGEAVEIGVDDDGPGIQPAARGIVLERGVRLGPADRRGSGLGLSNVAATMHAQGGDVEVGGAAAGGARVVLTLPSAATDAVSHR